MLDFTCSDSPIAYDHRVDINRKREAEAHFDSDGSDIILVIVIKVVFL